MSYAPEEDFSLCSTFLPFLLTKILISRRHICSVLLPVSSHCLPPPLLPQLSVSRTGPGKSLRLRLLEKAQSVLPISESLHLQLLPTEASFSLWRAGGLSAGRPNLQAERRQSARTARWVERGGSCSNHPSFLTLRKH